jgi:hypothetical protein
MYNICAYSKWHSVNSNVCLSFCNLYSLSVDQYFVRIIPCIQSFVKRLQTSHWSCNWTNWEVTTNEVPQKDSYEVIEERQNVVFIEWYQPCTTIYRSSFFGFPDTHVLYCIYTHQAGAGWLCLKISKIIKFRFFYLAASFFRKSWEPPGTVYSTLNTCLSHEVF